MVVNPEAPTNPISRRLKAKLIFNPNAGRPDLAQAQLIQILTYLQAWQIQPEVYVVTANSRLEQVVSEAVRHGIHLVIACGGDGTVDALIGALIGTQATLGILPIGTRNNIALSLGIPVGNLAASVALLRRGERRRIDVGRASCGRRQRWFFESASVGLVPALYPAADDIQHGNLARIGDLLGALVSLPLAEMRLFPVGGRQVNTQAHMILASNMPFFGPNIRISSGISYSDGLLDVFVFSNLTKLDLLGFAVQVASGLMDDPRIQHYMVRGFEVYTSPLMPVLADGTSLGQGPLKVSMRKHGLAVMTGASVLTDGPDRDSDLPESDYEIPD
jgi:diacylglycerol kinase family enzyme